MQHYDIPTFEIDMDLSELTEPPEHAACRERTPGEQQAVTRRIMPANRMACTVCGAHHDQDA